MLKKTDLFSIKSENDFNQKALEVFQFQSENCNVYKQFLILGKKPVLMHSISKFYLFDKNSILSVILPKHKISFWKSRHLTTLKTTC